MKNTTIILQQLRLLMLNMTIVGDQSLFAYIIPSSDAHHNIRRADCDQRVAFVSGFDGSSGTAIVTPNEALLWTDARYFIQAEQQMDDNWTLMKDGLVETPSQAEWLRLNLPNGAFVGIDPTLYSKVEWTQMSGELHQGNLTLKAVDKNLVDIVWGSNRPQRPQNPVTQLGIQFTGKSVEEKLEEIRADLDTMRVETMVICELDDVAWLLNLRGTDLPQAPTFFSFAILTNDTLKVFVDQDKLSDVIRNSLISVTGGKIEFYQYENTILDELTHQVNRTAGKVLLSKNCNFALTNVVEENRQLIKLTPITLKKAIKNPTEMEGMRRALIRDAATLCQFYSWLEKAMQNGENVTEVSAASYLYSLKQQQENFVSLSFKTISGSGPNGAIIHYFPTNETDRPLSINEMYLVDSGSHYLDGTTDITRTFHFGTPNDHQKDCFTRVLKGQIAIATSKFPNKIPGNMIDSFARQYLWQVGLDFGHGTGHGVGAYLNVGEGPQSINSKYNPDDPGLQENMITSNEPGYYEEGNFGIRLENLVRVAKVNGTDGFLQMEDLTFVPYQQKLIDVNLLTYSEIQYINDYQKKCRDIIGKFILDNDMGQETYDWLVSQTEPLSQPKGSMLNRTL